MKKIYDRFRGQWVVATPEEFVRQNWLMVMIEKLEYPLKFIVVEKELKMLPHLQRSHHFLPKRRIDIVVFSRRGKTPTPLLLIECKRGALSSSAMNQALAYNTFVQARYVAVANPSQIRFQWGDKEIDWLPPFDDLDI